jgi:hypothetical protein
MGTAVKFDEAAIATGSHGGARFSVEGRAAPCLAWAYGDAQPEAIDGKSGRALRSAAMPAEGDEATGTALVSRRALFAKHAELLRLTGRGERLGACRATYGAAKLEASAAYARARRQLLGGGAFSEWVVSDPALNQWRLSDLEAADEAGDAEGVQGEKTGARERQELRQNCK